MRITKFGHACVRIESGATTVVIDPGCFTEPDAVDAVSAVLITHEHPDHYLPEHLGRTDAPIFTIAAVAERIRSDAPEIAERVVVVQPGDTFDIGIAVQAVGERHAVIHPDYERFFNTGYLLNVEEQRIYHPGDSFSWPDSEVDLLCLPVSAPWLKVADAIDFARSVGAVRNLAIHDRVYSDAGLTMIDAHFANLLGERQEFCRLGDGADLAG